MATDPYFADTGPGWNPHSAEAGRLAGLLRSERLTLLCGPARSGKSTLLQQGLLPLLQRRADDAPGATGPQPLPERHERRHTGGGVTRELAVFFDLWGEHPAARLKARIQDELGLARDSRALADLPLNALLRRLHADTGLRFLLLLDAFDYCLDPPAELAAGALAFSDELLEAMADAAVPLQVLLILRDDTLPRLERWRPRRPDVDRHSLRLPPYGADGETPAGTAGPPRDRAGAAHPGGAPPMRSGGADVPVEVHASIAAALASFGPLKRPPPGNRPDRAEPATPPPRPPPRSARWVAWASAWSSRIRARHPRRTVPLAALVVVGGAAVWWVVEAGREPEAPPRVATADAALPAPAARVADPLPAPVAATGAPMVVVSKPAGAVTEMVSDLARRVGPDAGLDIRTRPVAGWQEALRRLREGDHLAVARYDALRAARTRSQAGLLALRVVAPLAREEVVLLVRADSPLQFIHQIRGQRLNAGPPGSSRALTAGTLYAALFGAALPDARADARDEATALRHLLAGDGIDVLVHVDAQPSRWLAGLPRATADGLKVLTLDLSNAASRRALRQFLPARLHPAGHPGALVPHDLATLATMAFLVTAAEATPTADERLATLARGLCQQLDPLRDHGHPAWKALDPALQLEVGWPYAAPASREFQRCASGAKPPAGPARNDRSATVSSTSNPGTLHE